MAKRLKVGGRPMWPTAQAPNDEPLRASWRFLLNEAFDAWRGRRPCNCLFDRPDLAELLAGLELDEDGYLSATAIPVVAERFRGAPRRVRTDVIRSLLNGASYDDDLPSPVIDISEMIAMGAAPNEVADTLRWTAEYIEAGGVFSDESHRDHMLAFLDAAVLCGVKEDLYRAADDDYRKLPSEELKTFRNKMENRIKVARKAVGVKPVGRRGVKRHA